MDGVFIIRQSMYDTHTTLTCTIIPTAVQLGAFQPWVSNATQFENFIALSLKDGQPKFLPVNATGNGLDMGVICKLIPHKQYNIMLYY